MEPSIIKTEDPLLSDKDTRNILSPCLNWVINPCNYLKCLPVLLWEEKTRNLRNKHLSNFVNVKESISWTPKFEVYVIWLLTLSSQKCYQYIDININRTKKIKRTNFRKKKKKLWKLKRNWSNIFAFTKHRCRE